MGVMSKKTLLWVALGAFVVVGGYYGWRWVDDHQPPLDIPIEKVGKASIGDLRRALRNGNADAAIELARRGMPGKNALLDALHDPDEHARYAVQRVLPVLTLDGMEERLVSEFDGLPRDLEWRWFAYPLLGALRENATPKVCRRMMDATYRLYPGIGHGVDESAVSDVVSQCYDLGASEQDPAPPTNGLSNDPVDRFPRFFDLTIERGLGFGPTTIPAISKWSPGKALRLAREFYRGIELEQVSYPEMFSAGVNYSQAIAGLPIHEYRELMRSGKLFETHGTYANGKIHPEKGFAAILNATAYEDEPTIDAKVASPKIEWRNGAPTNLPAFLRKPGRTQETCQTWFAIDVVPRPGEQSPFDFVHRPTALAELTKGLNSTDERTKYRAAFGLAFMGEPKGLAELTSIANGRKAEWSGGAYTATWFRPQHLLDYLADRSDAKSLIWLEQLATAKAGPKLSPYWRLRAYGALYRRVRNTKHVDDALALIKRCIDGAESDEALCLLYDLPGGAGAALLDDLVKQTKFASRAEAARRGLRPGSKSTAINTLLTHGFYDVNSPDVRRFVGERSPELEPLLQKGLSDPVTSYRRVSLYVLAKWDRAEAVPAIRKELARFNDDGKQIACVAATHFGKELRKDVEVLAADPRWTVRRACAIALGQIGGEPSPGVLEKLTQDPVGDVAAAAKAAMTSQMPKLRTLVDKYWIADRSCMR